MLNLSKNVMIAIMFPAMFVFSSLSFSAPQDTVLEQQVRQAVKNSKVTVETRSDAVVAILPVDGGFHPKREGVLLPASLRPLTKIAQLVKQDNTLAVLIVGHTDDAGSIYVKQDVSEKRASSVGSIFRIAGITNKQMLLSGVGSTQPKVSNATKKGKALNQRVEIIILKKPYNQSLTDLPYQYAANFSQ